ncbi:FAD-binding oxidoreductase [Chromobacterium sp. S0633]|uniref:NAD(P)/FAD-dependent oxidoreductase n=1 Tax=Chromobacterium sp. S0633 TaxID=2957805 RepID=UPI00209FB41C|nr:FAD-dependent oxidoreductase [Chromobacterium sp. S0633]MCP1290626.1 FAD-binding oxidoreductase [Chromobacterium sp. S0633]
MKRSLWLQEVSADLTDGNALDRDLHVDIAIIGGGFVGLWTALQILEKRPATQIAIVEQDVCGGGASGRNGGFVMSWWPKIRSLSAICGPGEALRLVQASEQAIDDIDAFCRRHAIDAHFRRAGWLWTATTPAQHGAWLDVQQLAERLGHPTFVPLPAEEVARRSGSPQHLQGVIETGNATVQPARLARGLRRVALENGVRIFEHSPVRRIERGQPARLITPGGTLSADKVVIASNAWAVSVPELARSVLPVTSTLLATPPIPERLTAIGWTGGEAITDSQLLVDYYRTTRDHRIVFGKGTGRFGFNSRIDAGFDDDPALNALTESDFRRVYPTLADVAVEHSWSGPIDRSYDSLPLFGRLPDAPHLVYGIGWSGNGVGPSRIGAQILSSLALDLDDAWSRCPLVGRAVRQFPPEPFRYLGGKLVRAAVLRKEAAEAERRPAAGLDRLLSRLAPAGLEDKG